MTSKAMQTYTVLTKALEQLRACVRADGIPYSSMPQLDDALCAHLEALNEKITGLCNDAKRAEQEFEKKDAALKIAGEELRAAQEKASSGNRLVKLEGAWAYSTKIASGIFVGEALKEAQAVVAEWLVPDGIRARDAMKKLVGILDNEGLEMALRHFPGTDDRG